jgi:glucokinase
MHSEQLVLALDFGGTKHTAAVIPAVPGPGRTWRAHERLRSPAGADAAYDQGAMLRLGRRVLSQAGGAPVAIGVSFGGPVDYDNGVVKLSHHVPGWENVPLRERLQAEFGVPCAVDNDANAAAFGEYKYGAGQGRSSLLYVTVSTGIGGGWVIAGQTYRGADGMAGEIGHVVVNPGGMECVCGKLGCLEAEACGPAIARKYRERANLYSPITGEFVAQAAAQGDSTARQVLEEAARMLGKGLGGAINLMNPSRIVLGGGVVKSGESYWQQVRASAREQALPQLHVEIVPAHWGDDAPLWGAVALAEQLL